VGAALGFVVGPKLAAFFRKAGPARSPLGNTIDVMPPIE
jgi:hypothetical protein